MGVFRRNKKAVGYYFLLLTFVFLLFFTGCTIRNGEEETGNEQRAEPAWQPSYELTEETLLTWDYPTEVETKSYQVDWGTTKILEGEKSLFCGWEFWEEVDKQILFDPLSYQILYADEYYLCVYRQDSYRTDTGQAIMEPNILTICLQNPVFEVGNAGSGYQESARPQLYSLQEDTDYPNGFWPGNGINLSLEKMLQEIEAGNCYMDRAGYEVYQESPERFIGSIREQFKQIEEIGYVESYKARFGISRIQTSLKMYIREGRVGFFIRLKDGEPGREEFPMPVDFAYDFRIEVEYDWKQDAPIYHMPYEVYTLKYEDGLCGKVLYPQVKGLETADKINALMKENIENNIKMIDMDLIRRYREDIIDVSYSDWTEKPPIGPPRVLFRSEQYLCIRQEPLLPERKTLRYMKGWQRDYVYDLKTGECLSLGDLVRLDEEFVSWLQETEKVEGGDWESDLLAEEIPSFVIERLKIYQKDFLLETLREAEFYLKSGQLFIWLPSVTNSGDAYVDAFLGKPGPSYREYMWCRISVEDLGDFLIAEPW